MQTQTNETRTPADRWNLTTAGRVEIDGEAYVVVDDGTYRYAMPAADFDAPTSEADYSLWCSSTPGVGDQALCARIARAAEVKGLVTAGSCIWVDAATEAEEVAARLGGDGQRWETTDGVSFDDLVKDADREHERRGDADASVRYVFDDGSVIVAWGVGGWDVGYADCWCGQGAGHTDDCAADGASESYVVTYRDEQGVEWEARGESLQELQTELDEQGCTRRMAVRKVNGEILGWVGGPDGWRYA